MFIIHLKIHTSVFQVSDIGNGFKDKRDVRCVIYWQETTSLTERDRCVKSHLIVHFLVDLGIFPEEIEKRWSPWLVLDNLI